MEKRIIWLNIMVLLISIRGFAISLPDSYNESYLLLTDRNLYAVGERIYFSVLNTSPAAIRDACWSSVIHVQILKPDGTSVAQGKFPLECHGTSSFLAIPEDILTGNYYLCAYTKWMRNFSPAQYSFTPLKIINPFTPELEGMNTPNGNHRGPTDSIQASNQTYPDGLPFYRLRCGTDKAIYGPGEEIKLDIHYSGAWQAVSGHISISVTRPTAADTLLQHPIPPRVNSTWEKPEPAYLPEIGGPALSGRVLNGESQAPVENARVELSVFSDSPRLMAYKTNPDGTFHYVLDDFAGSLDMFIAARNSDQSKLEVLIDNDYTMQQISFPSTAFALDSAEKETAQEIMLNMQLEKIYNHPAGAKQMDAEPARGSPLALHGIPTRKVRIDEFIELPNLKEIFIELVPEVSPKTRNRRNYLSFSGNEMTREIISQFDPLILIDQVPVYNIDKLLALSPKRIRSIEVINDLYVIGKTSCGGFINIVSNAGDMGGIDLPEHSMFFKYEGFQESINPREWENQAEPAGNPDLDFRNCLYWEPGLPVKPEQTRTQRFYASDKPGRYLVLIRGVDENGVFLYGSCSFQVHP